MKQQICVESLFNGVEIIKYQKLTIEQGVIQSITPFDSTAEKYLPGTLAAGFIDIQVNGGGGVLFNDATDISGITTIGEAHNLFGTTSWFPTLITDHINKMHRAADAVSDALKNNTTGVAGIHFEGPHISTLKNGVHEQSHIRPLSESEFSLYTREDIGQVIVTLDADRVSDRDIHRLSEQGVIVCQGHSNASYARASSALAAGARGFTHLFNAMSQLNAREPGMVGAALNHPESFYGIILDGIHVHEAAAKIAYEANPHLLLVTDAMPPVGSNQTEFHFFGEDIRVHNNRLINAEGRLAGSLLNMNQAVMNCSQWLNLSVEKSLNLSSLQVAKFINKVTELGTITPGKKANLVLLDDQLQVQRCWIEGRKIR